MANQDIHQAGERGSLVAHFEDAESGPWQIAEFGYATDCEPNDPIRTGCSGRGSNPHTLRR